MMGRLLLLAAACSAAALLAGPAGAAGPVEGSGAEASAAAKPGRHWAEPQIAAVVAAGLMGPDVASFRPDDPVTRGELHEAILALGKPHGAPVDPARPVTIRELDAQLVAAVGLLPAARTIRLAVRDAGLEPPDLIGTETVARLLGLRVNHPQGSEDLERQPRQLAPRAEAAYSLARVLALSPGTIEAIGARASAFALPALTPWQAAVLSRAVRFVGLPYVWAGASERAQEVWSATGAPVPAPGGFDCSGFVWRVYKVQPYAEAPFLGDVLVGRTTYAMSGEVAQAFRIGLDGLRPGDVLFFGSRGPRSRPADVGHSGIYVGNGWFVHSSSAGVTLQPLEGWYATSFAWARRPLAEAGLEA